MSSPSIDLDMNLLSSPVPPPSTRAGEDGGVGRNNIHSQSSFAFTENEHNVNNNNGSSIEGINCNSNSSNSSQSTYAVNGRGGDDSHSFATTAMATKSSEHYSLASNNTKSNVTNDSITQKESTSAMDISKTDDNDENDDGERMVINGKPTQKYNDMTRMVESWREELYMMNVKNSIMLDDLVKLGADV